MGGLDNRFYYASIMANYIVPFSAGLVMHHKQLYLLDMFISRILLNTKYRMSQFVGAGIVKLLVYV